MSCTVQVANHRKGTLELAAGGMIDRIEFDELMSRAVGRELVAADPPARPQGVPDRLAMFDHYSRHGFHGGTPSPCGRS